MTLTFHCASADEIQVGTECTSHIGNTGFVSEIQSDMRDLDGAYWIGYRIQWRNKPTSASFVTLSEITIWRPGFFVFSPSSEASSVEMTEQEKKIVEMLGEVWNLFLELPVQNPTANQEFCAGIHVLQHHVAARPALRALRQSFKGVSHES